MGVVKKDIKVVGVGEEDAEDRIRGSQLISSGNHLRKKPEVK